MSAQVYVVSDPLAIDVIQQEDLNGFKEYLDSNDTLILALEDTPHIRKKHQPLFSAYKLF